MAIRVELKSPYGVLTAPDGRKIKSGERGWTTGACDGRKPFVKFGRFNSRSLPVAVPQHWIVPVTSRRKST